MSDKTNEVAARELVDGLIDEFDAQSRITDDGRETLVKVVRSGRFSHDRETGRVRYVLAKPLELDDGRTIRELELAGLSAGEKRRAAKKNNGVELMLAVICAASGLKKGEAKRLGIRDMSGVTSIAALFR